MQPVSKTALRASAAGGLIPKSGPPKRLPLPLVLTLKDPAGQAVDFESCRVGFRQVEIKDGLLLVNGKRLVMRGVDRHEHHPSAAAP
jgi:hypothetical protein